VLSFQVNDSVARGSIADASGVQSWNLEDADEIRSLCAAARQALQAGDWAAFDRVAAPLGDGLLSSLPVALPETIFLSTQGALAGIPFDALVFDGERLAARHRVVNLASLQGLSSNGADLRFPAPESVFLAGDPRDWTGDFALRLDPSDEVRAVSERFVGPGLHVVQGVSLLQDEFTGGEYGQADLVHLSIPGSVGLSTAPGSKLVLSEPGRDAGREEMNAETLAGLATRAGLVFFSRTEFSGVGNTGNTDLGVVSAVLNAGARAVIASLWRVQDTARNRMVSGFYDQLQDERDLATALAIAKRDYMQTEAGLDWASFQLFLN
jgi:CHAT domain-containing protein